MSSSDDLSGMVDIVFRAAQRSDLPRIVALLADDDIGRSREDASVLLNCRYVEAFDALERDPNQLMAVVEAGGEVVGRVQITFIPGLSRLGMWRGQIESVRIASSQRGEGLGRRLFEWAIAECRKRGCGLVAELTTDKARPDALRFYELLGVSSQPRGHEAQPVRSLTRDRPRRSASSPAALASATSAAVSGVIGSRAGTTRPMVCTASGSTIGMARMVAVRPSVSASRAGITLAQRPVRTCANRTIIEFDSSVGCDIAAGGAQQAVDDAAVLHVGREQAERHLRDLGPGDALAVAERRVGGGQQLIALLIERHRVDAAERLVVEIGDAGVDLEVLEQREDLDRGARQDGEAHVGMAGAKGRGERATIASAVGIAAMRSCPARPCLSALISSRMARESPTMRRAQSSVRSPSGVKPMKREPRCTRRTPSVSSSCLMPAESVGWVTPQDSAARPKCRSRASAIRYSSLSSMGDQIHKRSENATIISSIENFNRGIREEGIVRRSRLGINAQRNAPMSTTTLSKTGDKRRRPARRPPAADAEGPPGRPARAG